jgi:hypothetical protein
MEEKETFKLMKRIYFLKARYYDQRFIPALDAFNYILYKYPNSSNIYEAKIWRGKQICDWVAMLFVNNMTTLLGSRS